MNIKFTALTRITGLICAVSFCASLLSAQTLYWVGESGNWNDPQNWSFAPGGTPANIIPLSSTDVVISSDTRAEILVSEKVFCSGLTCLSRAIQARLVIESGAAIVLHGNVELCDSLRISGGRLEFQSGNCSLIQNGAVLNTSILVNGANLRITGGLSLGDSAGIIVESGNLITGKEGLVSDYFRLMEQAGWINGNTSLYCYGPAGLHLEGNINSEGNRVRIFRPYGLEEVDRQWAERDGRIEFEYRQLPTCATGPGQTPFTIDAIVISNYNGEDISCNGANDGIATVTVSGGIGPFTYQWIGGDVPGFTQNYNNLGAGTYTVLVTDLGQGVTCVDNVQLAEPPPITIFSLTLSPPSCENLCNGGAFPIAIGGVPGYEYLWSSGETGFQAVQLCEGTNSVVITDSNGCSFDSTFQLIREPIEFGLVLSEILCAGESTGEASANPSGGAGGPYVISWSNGQSGPAATGLSAQSYTLTVTDAANCTADTVFTMTELPGIDILEENIIDESCAGNLDGAISVSVSGGTAPYIILWSGPDGFNSALEDITGLGAGTYALTITDANTCEEDASFIVEAPPAIDLSAITEDIDCPGALAGLIDLTVSGGTAPFSFEWTGPGGFTSPDEDISLLEAGLYSVTVTDAVLCSETAQFEILEPEEIAVVETIIPVSCAGGSDGEIAIAVSGGTSPYIFSWQGPGGFVSSEEDVFGLSAGTYDLSITDANSCSIDLSFILDEPGPIMVDAMLQDPLCAESSDGAVGITISGGQNPYAVSWTGPNAFTSTEEDISGLAPGSYSLEITDIAGCIFEADYTLEAPPLLEITGVVTDISCGGLEDGAIDLSISGGTAPYFVVWNGPNGFFSDLEDIGLLDNGTYNLTVTDSQGCETTDTFVVDENPPLEADAVVSPVDCAGNTNGSIDLSPSGGTPPYNFTWTGPNGFTASTEDITGLSPGDYSILLSDANGCIFELTLSLDEPAPFMVDATLQDPLCAESSDGAIGITINGGQSPYFVSWSGPNGYTSTLEDISGLAPGSYSLEITDLAGCLFEADYTLEAPPLLEITGVVTDVSCGGLEDGAIDLSISGGTAPYFVEWNGPNSFISGLEDIDLLDNGTYNLTVTDSQGCETTESFVVDENPPLEADAVVSPVDCAGNTTGSIDLSPSGGTPPYNFTWTGPNGFTASTEDITGLSPGDYSILLSDANGCIFELTLSLDEPEQIQILADVSAITCPGAADAFINASAEGGVSPYNYSWTGPGGFAIVSANIGPLGPGLYTLTVTDAAGCESEAEFVLSEPTPLVLIPIITGISCGGLSDGVIELSVLGGTPGYSYSWTGPNGFTSNQEDLNNLSQGLYELELTDNAGCSTSATYEVGGQDVLETSPEVSDISCFGETDGSVILNISGGVSPYSVSWTGPGGYSANQEDISGIPAGIYQYSIVDFNGCILEGSIEIAEAQEIQALADVTDPSCYGLSDGSIVLNISGGSAPYTVDWSGGQNGETLLNLGAGTYTATITDNTGCTLVLDPVVLQESVEITVDFAVTNVVCAGEPNGSIDATVAGGEPGYTYSWEGPEGFTSGQEDIFGLGEGSYTLTVTDSEGCSATSGIDITAPELIDISAALTQPLCAGGSGTIDLSVAGGTAPYSFSWTGPNGFVSGLEDIVDLPDGSYQVQVTDANNCFGQASFEFESVNPLSVIASVNPADCSGEDNGSIDLTLSGGTPGYDIIWSGPNGFTSTDEDISALAQGDYSLMVTDAQSCSLDTVFTVAEPPAFLLTATVESPVCAQENTGSVDLTVSGGFPPYIYSWSGPDGFTSDQEDLNGLNPGDYQLLVSDQGSCVNDTLFSLTEVPGIFIDAALTDILCGGVSSGSITLSISGGLSPYQFNWSGPEGFMSSDQNLANLNAGEYDLNLSDANGCAVDTSFTISTPQLIEVVFTVDNPLCGVLNGSIQAEVSGGQVAIDYIYEWFDISDGLQIPIGNGPSVIDLGPGLYEFVVTDDNGCFFTDIVPLSDEPGYIEITSTDLLCPGDASGSISVDIFEGTPPYVISWTGPDGFSSSQEDLAGLSGGEYFLVITDANDCEINETVTISEPEELTLNASATDVTCNGNNNGSVNLTPAGGTLPYTFNWIGDNGFSSVDEDITGLSAGQYTLVLTDANQCTAETTVSIIESQLLEVSISYTGTLCAGQATGTIDLEVNGGTEPYLIEWTGPNAFSSGQQDLFDLSAGDYQLMLQDAEGCFRDTSITIAEASPLEVLLDIIQPSCGEANGSATALPAGGVVNGDYSYTWYDVSNGDQINLGSGNTITGIGNGIYQVEITDDLGCSLSETFNLSDAGGSLEGTVSDLTCFNSGDGAIDLIITGGLAPYSISWSGPEGFTSNSEDLSNLVAGEYSVQADDANGCGYTAIFEINEPQQILLDISTVSITCNGSNNGAISVSVGGGTGNIDINWFGPGGFSANGEQISGLSPDCYQLVVQDETGCTSDSTICLVEPDILALSAAITGILCGGEATGSIDLSVIGGTPGFNYSWVGPNGFVAGGVEDVAALFAGAYDVLVSDANNCEVTATFVVDENTTLSGNPDIVSPLCFGSADGSINLEVFGGTQPFSVEWIGPNGYSGFEPAITDLQAGDYIWLLSDVNGCFLSDTVVLTDPSEIVIDTLVIDISCFGLNNGSIELLINGGTPAYSVFWTGPNGFSSTAEDIFNLAPGSYQYQIGDSNACTETGVLQIDEPLELILSLDNTVNPSCSDSFDGSIDLDIQGGEPGYSVIWTNGQGEEFSTQEDISGLGPDVFSVEVYDINGCSATAADIELIALTTVEALASTDTIYCEGSGPVLLTGLVNGQESFGWFDENAVLLSDSLSVLVNPPTGTWYYVLSASSPPCSAADTVFVTVLPAPFADAGEDQFIFPEEVVNIGGNPSILDESDLIEWSPASNLDNTGSPNPQINGLLQDQWFVLTVTDINGCIAIDSALVSIIPEIDIPDGFSPNGDLINDVWEIGNTEQYPSLVVEIYNRWGDLLFRSEGYEQPWDGRYNGDLLPIGTYYYIIEIDEPEFSEKITGPLTILR